MGKEGGQREGTGQQIQHGACFTTQANGLEEISKVRERKDLVFALKELFAGLNVRWKLNPWVKRWGSRREPAFLHLASALLLTDAQRLREDRCIIAREQAEV